MPYRTEARPEAGCILSYASGVLTRPDMIAEVTEWQRLLAEDARLRVLVVDHVEADISQVSPADVKAVADHSDGFYEIQPELFTVSVVIRDLDFALGRMWQAWAEADARARMVRSRAEATAVLAELGVELDLTDEDAAATGA